MTFDLLNWKIAHRFCYPWETFTPIFTPFCFPVGSLCNRRTRFSAVY